ncbi:acyltransferase-like protein, chloroplastic, partial [Tanacetum coccineum]
LPHISILFRVFGMLSVTASNMFKLFSIKQYILLYPGGAREALHRKGEVHKLFWPEHQEFFRMAAKFGATIVPLKSVNEVNYTFSKLGVSGIGKEFGKKSVHLCFVWYAENEDEMQIGISIIEGLGKHHQAEPSSGRSQYVEGATLVHGGSFLDKPKQVYTMGSVLNLHTLEAKEDSMMRQEPCPAVYPPLPALLPEWPFATEAVQEVHAASISE